MTRLSNRYAGGLKGVTHLLIVIPLGQTAQTATITAVNVDKTVINFCGHYGDPASPPLVRLTNSTTVTADRGGGGQPVTVSIQVVEYY